MECNYLLRNCNINFIRFWKTFNKTKNFSNWSSKLNDFAQYTNFSKNTKKNCELDLPWLRFNKQLDAFFACFCIFEFSYQQLFLWNDYVYISYVSCSYFVQRTFHSSLFFWSILLICILVILYRKYRQEFSKACWQRLQSSVNLSIDQRICCGLEYLTYMNESGWD